MAHENVEIVKLKLILRAPRAYYVSPPSLAVWKVEAFARIESFPVLSSKITKCDVLKVICGDFTHRIYKDLTQ